jgi:hypothetical protein
MDDFRYEPPIDLLEIPRGSFDLNAGNTALEIQETFARFRPIEDAFVPWLATLPRKVAVSRPKPDRWSILENMRHLIFASELHFDHNLRGSKEPYLAIGLPPTGMQPNPKFAVSGTAQSVELDEAIAARAVIRDRIYAYVAQLTDEQLNVKLKGQLKPPWVYLSTVLGHELHHLTECQRIAAQLLKQREKSRNAR